jgi:hypothetical protein
VGLSAATLNGNEALAARRPGACAIAWKKQWPTSMQELKSSTGEWTETMKAWATVRQTWSTLEGKTSRTRKSRAAESTKRHSQLIANRADTE